MPWTCTDPMLERAKLVSLYHDGLYSAAELAERFSVSRFGRLQVDRALPRGRGRSPRPLGSARTEHTGSPTRGRPRSKRPSWPAAKPTRPGVRKSGWPTSPGGSPAAARRQPDLALPACSTAGAILKRHRLTQPRRRRRKAKHPGRVPLVTKVPCDVGCADFKGQFLLGGRVYCYPLTVTDGSPTPTAGSCSSLARYHRCATIGEAGRRLCGLRAALP